MFGKQPTNNAAANELVSVSLKSLINLATLAAGLNFQRPSVKAQQSGGYVSRFKGRGMEFEEARIYQPGDDIRSIDWRVTARTSKTYTKVFREERERPIFISVDNRSTMHFATRGVFKSVLAAKIAGLMAWTAQHHGDRIGGQIFTDNTCREVKPQNGKHAVLRFFNALLKQEDVKFSHTIGFDHILARLTQHARPGSLVYVISDFRGINEPAEVHLSKLSRHCDVVLVFVYDPLESQLPERGCYRFTDDGRDVMIDTGDHQRVLRYQQHFAQRQQQLQRIAKKMGLTFIQCSTAEDPIKCLR